MTDLTKYHFTIGSHRQKPIIWVQFPKDSSLINSFKKEYPQARWSASVKRWYLPDTEGIRKKLKLTTPAKGKGALLKIHPVNQVPLQNFINQLRLKAYSPNTMAVYTNEFAQLLKTIGGYPVDNLTPEKLKSYFLYCVKTLQLSESHLNSRINAVKFYYEQVLHRPRMFFDIPRPKKPLRLPLVLSKEEIIRLLRQPENSKHKLMLRLCYGMGLRVSEITALKIEHIDSKRMQVLIQAAKGKKDRYVNLPQSVLTDLRAYYKEFRPKEFLFEGQHGGRYSVRSVQLVFKQAMKKARIRKKVGIHGLRHSYATHLLEHGTDISFIQKLLGHKDIRTTLLYTNVADTKISAIQSPLDQLE